MGLVFQHTGIVTTRKFIKERPDMQTVLDDIADRDPKTKNAEPQQFVDFTFIRELDQSGFIDRLYRKK